MNFEDEISLRKNQFYQSELVKEEKTVLLIGSSHMAQLNTTHIQKILDEKDLHYTVYNIAFAGDKPEKRLLEINEIVELQPKIVVYGLGYRDFSHFSSNKDIIIPDLEDKFHNLGEKAVLGYDFPTNPKFVTLSAVQSILKKSNESINSELESRPFFDNDMNLIEIKNNSKIIQDFNIDNFGKFDVRKNYDNANFIALQKIMKELNNKKIQTILYVTPHHPLFIKSIEKETENNFNEILKYFETNENIIYNYKEKYSDEEIWADLTHIAYNKNSLKYSEDMAKIIIENIDS